MKFKYEAECDCETCKGYESSGLGLMGGWICMCPCHTKTNEKKLKKAMIQKEAIKAKRTNKNQD